VEHVKTPSLSVSKTSTKNQMEYLKCKDHLVSGEIFSLVLDDTKKLLVTSPQPGADDLGKYYESEAYISHTDSKKGIVSFLYQTVKKYSLKKKVGLVRSMQKDGKRILDIGAGTGDFLFRAKSKKWDVEGVEVNPAARKLAKEKGVELKDALNQVRDRKFDVITLWHVLEHIPNLEETIQHIENLLAPGGTVLIAVPNYKSFDAKYYNSFWAAYDVPRHLWHFSKESMDLLFSSNIVLQKMKPMWFDAFYVSLLSEKYKTGNGFSLKALWIGFWSNFRGLSTKEYSSHIYCYKSQL